MVHPIFSLGLKEKVYLTFSHLHFSDKKKLLTDYRNLFGSYKVEVSQSQVQILKIESSRNLQKYN